MLPSPVRRTLAAAALAAALAPGVARAQVNAEALRSDIAERSRYLSLQASYNGHVGNVNGSVVSGALFAGLNAGPHLAFVKLQLDYAQFSGVATIAKAFAHARYNYRLTRWLFAEAYAQLEQDKFQRLGLRQVDGAGLRFVLLKREVVALHYGTSWMLDYEKLSDDPGRIAPFPGAHWVAQRWSNYIAIDARLGPRARFIDVLYAQPRINGFADVRVLNDASFAIDIDKRFSGKISCQVHHNSTPPSRVKATDVDMLTSIVVTF